MTRIFEGLFFTALPVFPFFPTAVTIRTESCCSEFFTDIGKAARFYNSATNRLINLREKFRLGDRWFETRWCVCMGGGVQITITEHSEVVSTREYANIKKSAQSAYEVFSGQCAGQTMSLKFRWWVLTNGDEFCIPNSFALSKAVHTTNPVSSRTLDSNFRSEGPFVRYTLAVQSGRSIRAIWRASQPGSWQQELQLGMNL